MNTKKGVIVLSLLLLVFLINGCAKQTHHPITGVVIDDVQIHPEKSYGGEDVGISVLVKNIGAISADDIEVSLKEDGFSSAGNVYIDYLEGIAKGRISANQDIAEWSVTANENENPFDIKYRPSVKVCYHYQTKAIIKIKSMPLEEYRILQQRGIIPDKYLQVTQTDGPIQMRVNTNPLLLKKGDDDEKISLNIEVVNTGLKYRGSVYNASGCPNTGMNNATITSSIIGTTSADTKDIYFLGGKATYRVDFDAP